MGNIVWLASYPKSGNTWVRAFLANLMANRADPLEPNELADYADDEALPERFVELAGRSSRELDLDAIATLRPQVHALIAQRAQGTRLVKSHNMAGSLDGQPLYNWQVTAGAIYVVRNPLDVAISMAHHFGLTNDEVIDRLNDERVATGSDAQFVTQMLGSWSQHVRSWLDVAQRFEPKIVVLRYEDLLEQPAKHFTKAARLLGLGQDRARIDRAVKHASFDVLAALEKNRGFSEAVNDRTRFFRRGRASQWRNVLTRDQVGRVVQVHGELMQRFKYIPSGFRGG